MVSVKEVRKGLYQRLNTAAVTGLLAEGSASLFADAARPHSDGTPALFPFLIISTSSEAEEAVTFGGHMIQSFLWLIKAVDHNSSPSVAEDIDMAVATRLHFQPTSLTVSGGSCLYLARESGVVQTETDGDELYPHRGALYRIRVQSPQ